MTGSNTCRSRASTEIRLAHQKNAAWRMVLSRNVLLDHVGRRRKAQSLDFRLLTRPAGSAGDIKVGDRGHRPDRRTTIVTGVFPQGERRSSASLCRTARQPNAATSTSGSADLPGARVQRAARDFRQGLGCGVPKAGALQRSADPAAAPRAKNHSIPIVGSVQFRSADRAARSVVNRLLIVTDVSSGVVTFATADVEILDRVRTVSPDGCTVEHSDRCNPVSTAVARISFAMRCGPLASSAEVGEKHVPVEYLFNDARVRARVLRGLMDSQTARSMPAGRMCRSRPLRRIWQTVWVPRPLARRHHATNNEGRQRPAGAQSDADHAGGGRPFWLSRKAERVRPKRRYSRGTRYITAVEPKPTEARLRARIAHPPTST